MSFVAAQLSVLAYANGFTHWHYRSADPLPEILSTAYFALAADMLRPGDQMTVNLLASSAIGLAQCVVAGIDDQARPQLALLAATPFPSRAAWAGRAAA
jgi:hypothetical protein